MSSQGWGGGQKWPILRWHVYGRPLMVWSNFNCGFETWLISNNFHFRLTKGKMGVTRFFIFSTFLVLMFGFALSLPTVTEKIIGPFPIYHGKYKPYYLSFPVAYVNSLIIKWKMHINDFLIDFIKMIVHCSLTVVCILVRIQSF